MDIVKWFMLRFDLYVVTPSCATFYLKDGFKQRIASVQVRITASWAVANLCDALCSIAETDDAKEASKSSLSRPNSTPRY